MTAKDKILSHLQNHSSASAIDLRRAARITPATLEKTLSQLVESGEVEAFIGKNRARRYRLAGYEKRYEPVSEYLNNHDKAFACEVAAATGLEKQLTAKILKDMHEQGDAHRTWSDSRKAWLYSRKRDFVWGCANPMTAFINQRLKEVRA